MPLPTMVKILEKSTMEPWYRTDESKQQIGKKEVQTLVYDTLNIDYDPREGQEKAGTV